MAKSCLLIAAVVVAAAAAVLAIAIADAGEGSVWIPTNSPGTCQGSIAECMTDGEFEMDSEINRRMLATTKTYIGYGALRAGTTPCYRRGASYYNCRAGATNPYTRQCTTVTRCGRSG